MSVHSMYNLTATDGTTAQFAVGTRADIKGSVWQYIKASAAIAAYQLTQIDNSAFGAEATTTTAGAIPTSFVVPQFAFAIGEYGWAPCGPFGPFREDGGTTFKVNAAASCVTNVKLYTTATAGVIDDAVTTLIQGLRLTETITGAEAADCFAVDALKANC